MWHGILNVLVTETNIFSKQLIKSNTYDETS